MLFSHHVIKMAWAHHAQPPFHKEGALAHKALEEGGDGHGMKQKYCGYDGHVSQLFIFIHAGARSRRTIGRRGARRRIQDKADPPSWSATADGAFEVVVGSMPPLAPPPWSTAPSPVVIVVLRVAVRGNLHPRHGRGVLHQSEPPERGEASAQRAIPPGGTPGRKNGASMRCRGDRPAPSRRANVTS